MLQRHTVDRRPVAMVAATLATVFGLVRVPEAGGDWHFFANVSRWMFGTDGLGIYAQRSNVQTGPLTLLAVFLLDTAGGILPVLVIAATGIFTAWCICRLAPAAATTLQLLWLTATATAVTAWWSTMATFGHLDDATVIAGAAAATLLVQRGRDTRAAALVGVLIAVKPWAAVLVLMTLDAGSWRERRTWRRPLLSCAIGGALWAPFVIYDTHSLAGLSPQTPIAPDSLLRLAGLDGEAPAAIRIAQLLLATLAVGVAVRHRGPAAALLCGVAVRVAMDPGTWNYYTVGLVAGAAVWDATHIARRPPWATAVALLTFWPDWIDADPTWRAAARLLGLCVLAVVVARGTSTLTTAEPDPTETTVRSSLDGPRVPDRASVRRRTRGHHRPAIRSRSASPAHPTA